MTTDRSEEPLLAGRALEGLIDASRGKPLAVAQLARLVLSNGDTSRAVAMARNALEAAPEDGHVEAVARETLRKSVPGWHFPMLRDSARNRAFGAALERAIRPGDRVLDIGSGSGLLAMMAARAGAAEVVTCEMNPAVADAADQIIALNGYGDRIRLIGKSSFDLDLAEDVGGPVDVIVSEIISANLVGEGVLPVMRDAVARFLRPGGRVIPSRGEVRVALADYTGKVRPALDQVEGFDVSPFNRLAPTARILSVGDPALALRSEAGSLLEFDFQSGGPFREGPAQLSLSALGGPVNGVVQWFRIQLDEASIYENRPGADAKSSWGAIFHPFRKPLTPPPGAVLTVHGAHQAAAVHVWSDY